MQGTATKPIETRRVEQATDRDMAALRPTETRYGWCPYNEINLVGADGTINLYVQPHEIADENGRPVENPYHRTLPKGQLIPFITFNALEMLQSESEHDHLGRAKQIQGTRTVTALSAARDVLNRYSEWGFVILDSLTGVDQDTAFRIFQVIHPFEFPMGQLVNEMSFGARERIDATEPIKFPGTDYTVEPLRSDYERQLAEKVAAEMENGVQTALTLATETLNSTEQSMTQRFSGGNGKTGPDPNDRRLTQELGRELPQLIGKPDQSAAIGEMNAKIDYLAGREQSRQDREELERLRARVAELEGINGDTMKEPQGNDLPPFGVGDTVMLDGETVKVIAKPFGRYKVEHEDGETETVDRSELS